MHPVASNTPPTIPGVGSTMPELGILRAVGLIDAIPQKCAGQRTLPPMSVPMPRKDPPPPISAASPPETKKATTRITD